MKKANTSTAFLNRNLKGRPPSVKERCYTALVRPLVEYASTVWSPHTAVNMNKIEQVQRPDLSITTSAIRAASQKCSKS